MAGLPPDGEWLIQQSDGIVTIFHRDSAEELIRFDPSDANETARVQKAIYDLAQLDDEQKCFAHFWSGYFYGHATAFARDAFPSQSNPFQEV